ncbi:hypothetical protein [Marinobacter nauticus]|uniref:Integrase n=1 Tax=Marinobacter nauticus (strain ATCC 700491 / DSM 11845 / VT8) TaxID=351348 RepID=A1U315_MARN8|nr:hypothetical protein [Marinobacter nauticus]ABM19384.1 conserved hypothetical protein [Marinobacter nauticus VT8]
MSNLNAVSRLALRNYIDSARKLAIYGGESGWHSNRWETTTLRNRLSLDFCELRRKGANVAVPWQSPFLEFAKAYVRHSQIRKEVGTIIHELHALRFLYAALQEVHGTPDILKLDGAVQELVRQKVAAWYASGKPSRIGTALMNVYAELRGQEILPALPYWQSPWKRGLHKAYSMDPKAVEWRKAHTPDDQKLAAVLVAFEMAEADKDQYWTSLAMLLAFGSSRGGELTDLSLESLIDESYTDRYGRTRRRVGLRWFSEKGFGGNVKWVPRLPGSNRNEAQETELMDMVVRAFNRLVRLSEPARKAAKLAFDSDGTVYPIHSFCITSKDCSQNQALDDVEAAYAMGRTSILNRKGTAFGRTYRTRKHFGWHYPCVAYGSPTYREIAVADFENFSGKLDHWPHTSDSERVKVWDCLVLHQWNQFNEGPKKVYPNSYVLPSTNQLSYQLSGKWVAGKREMSSIFERLGLTMDDGSAIQLTSHDFRRWHGTRGRALAHMGLSEHRLRMLAGRQDISQNDAYDFNTSKQKAALYRPLIAHSDKDLRIHERLAIGTPIYRHELLGRPLSENELPQPTQVGEFGGCTHSIMEPPCQKGGDCLTCSEKKYVKGTPGCLERMREAAAHHKSEFDVLDAWQKKRDQLGIDQWMTFHVIRYAVAESLLRQMEDPTVPDGTVLGVDEHFDPSPLKVNLMAKGIEVPEKPTDLVTQEINELLGLVDDA